MLVWVLYEKKGSWFIGDDQESGINASSVQRLSNLHFLWRHMEYEGVQPASIRN